MVERSTSESDQSVSRSEISRVMAEMGRKGGLKGGKMRLQTMTPDERSRVALKAAQARWRKKHKKPKQRGPERPDAKQ